MSPSSHPVGGSHIVLFPLDVDVGCASALRQRTDSLLRRDVSAENLASFLLCFAVGGRELWRAESFVNYQISFPKSFKLVSQFGIFSS